MEQDVGKGMVAGDSKVHKLCHEDCPGQWTLTEVELSSLHMEISQHPFIIDSLANYLVEKSKFLT